MFPLKRVRTKLCIKIIVLIVMKKYNAEYLFNSKEISRCGGTIKK